MNPRQLVIPILLAVTAVAVMPFVIHHAEAHILKTFDNVSVKIGWLNEPPLQGDTNEIDVYLYNGTDDTAPPIADTGLDKMTISAQYGGKTEDITPLFTPSDDTPGLYTAALRPTQIGTYNVIIKGTIGGVTIPPTTYPMSDVEAKDKYYFPSAPSQVTTNPQPTSTTQPSGSVQTSSGQLSQNVVNQLTNDISDAKNTANNAAASYSKVAQSFQDVKNTTDSLYILNMAGIGIGAAGVVIAVISLTRKIKT